MGSKKKMEISTRDRTTTDFWNDPFFESPPPPPTLRDIEENMNSAFQKFGSFFNHHNVAFNNLNFSIPQVDISSMANDPNASVHSYTSSSMTTYMKNGKDKPQVYHAASSQLTAPGGVKETKKTLQDSRTGLKKMAIGRHLQDKGHVAQKSKNYYTGEEDENEDLINLDESKLNEFNDDWSKISNRPDIHKFRRFCSGMHGRDHQSILPQDSPRALASGVKNQPKIQPVSASDSSDLSLDGKKTLMHSGRHGRK